MSWVTVCNLDDILPNTGVGALIEGHQVAIFRLLGVEELYAIDNYDPASGANVLSRGLVGDLEGQLVVASPIYKHHYRLEDGVCLEDAGYSVNAHQVRVVDGNVEVQLNEGLLERAA